MIKNLAVAASRWIDEKPLAAGALTTISSNQHGYRAHNLPAQLVPSAQNVEDKPGILVIK
jgi:hypothetical protein